MARKPKDGKISAEITLFSGQAIRRIWHNGEWYYSIIDIISALTGSKNPSNYWSTIKARAVSEGFDSALLQIEQLKLVSADGKLRQTDVATRQTIFRIIQSIPSPSAEPFRLWLAELGEERLQEIENPAVALERIRERYRAKGYPDSWIEQRLQNDVIRNELTDDWRTRGVERGQQFAILTNDIHEGTFDLSVENHKDYKQLPDKTNLRDHMTTLELALISLGEATATQFHRDRNSEGFDELRKDAQAAGNLAGDTRKRIEESRGGRSVISPDNYLAQQRNARIESQNRRSKNKSSNQLELFGGQQDETEND